jgi:hypothetical protein
MDSHDSANRNADRSTPTTGATEHSAGDIAGPSVHRPDAERSRPPSRPRPWHARLRRRLHRRHALRTRTAPTGNTVQPAHADPRTSPAERVTTLADPAPRSHSLSSPAPAAAAWVRAGWNTGGVPYGYRARRVLVTPAHGRPRWRSHLIIEPVEAATVALIFTWRAADRLTTSEIARRLNAARYPRPLDPATGQPRPWTPRLIRTVITNPKYLGRQAWGRTHHGRPVPAQNWTWSAPNPHLALVTAETFAAAQLTQARSADVDPTRATTGAVSTPAATGQEPHNQPDGATRSCTSPSPSATAHAYGTL